MNCFLLVFDSTHQALRGGEELKRSSVPHEVMSTPPHLKADCGISLRVRPGDRERAEGALDAAGVIYSGVEPYYCKWLDDPE
jgi:hypothetical protein